MYSASGEFLVQCSRFLNWWNHFDLMLCKRLSVACAIADEDGCGLRLILEITVRQWEKTVKFSPAVDILWGKAYNEKKI